MTSLPIIESVIRRHTTPESFRRGQEYEELGAVLDVEVRGNLLLADVMGSVPEPYQVEIAFDASGITSASCSCPVEWGWCKHIVATLLSCLHQPELIEDRPPLEPSLADLTPDQLRAIISNVATRDHTFARAVDAEIARLRAAASPATSTPTAAAAPRPQPKPVDTKGLRRQVRSAIHGLDRLSGSEAYWMVGSVVGEVRDLLEQPWAAIRAGDGRTALAMLEAITDEYVEEWTNLDDSDGEAGALFAEIGEAWTEALLTADLTPDERQTWVERLEEWDSEVSDYGVDDAFSAAIQATESGWDDPDLQHVLAGKRGAEREWAGEADVGLTIARLNVLERQGRDEEYLRLARAEGLHAHYAAGLARLGRLDEAAAYALTHFSTPEETLSLAERLREREAPDLAIAVAEKGLSFDGPKLQLAVWLRDYAAELGRRDVALEAAEIAFNEERTLASYLRVQELAGDDWPKHRERLLDKLRKVGSRSFHLHGPVEILLHEGLIDAAVALVDGTSDYYALEPVVKAALATHPDWAIRSSKQQAEPIMSQGKSEAYHHAVRWLGHARDAYLAAGRRPEWQAYLDELLHEHSRKYKLVAMLKALGK
jgi:uncharacterized Zn finger protein